MLRKFQGAVLTAFALTLLVSGSPTVAPAQPSAEPQVHEPKAEEQKGTAYPVTLKDGGIGPPWRLPPGQCDRFGTNSARTGLLHHNLPAAGRGPGLFLAHPEEGTPHVILLSGTGPGNRPS